MISKLIGGFKEGYEMNEFQGNPDHWNGRSDKNGYCLLYTSDAADDL